MRRAVLALALSACIAPPTECTELGAQGGLELTVDARPGRYRIEVLAGGDTLSLTYDVTPAGATCVEPCSVEGTRFAFDAGTEQRKMVGLVTRLPDRRDGPDATTVRIFAGDTLLRQQAMTPAYTESEINGPGCGVTSTAAAIIEVPAP